MNITHDEYKQMVDALDKVKKHAMYITFKCLELDYDGVDIEFHDNYIMAYVRNYDGEIFDELRIPFEWLTLNHTELTIAMNVAKLEKEVILIERLIRSEQQQLEIVQQRSINKHNERISDLNTRLQNTTLELVNARK
jgi:hypothetical protein